MDSPDGPDKPIVEKSHFLAGLAIIVIAVVLHLSSHPADTSTSALIIAGGVLMSLSFVKNFQFSSAGVKIETVSQAAYSINDQVNKINETVSSLNDSIQIINKSIDELQKSNTKIIEFINRDENTTQLTQPHNSIVESIENISQVIDRNKDIIKAVSDASAKVAALISPSGN